MRISSADNHVRTSTGCISLVIFAFTLLATGAFPVHAANEVGAVPGSFAVSSTGAATYSIPISLPPGAAGLMPHLALVYNSQSGNGLAGYGWTLSGLSAITVCQKTWAQDGTNAGLSFAGTKADANDFCLDGSKLVLASGSYGAKNSTYRKEVDDFSNISAYVTGGAGPASTSGPQYFTVQTGNGLTYEYGKTADSEILASGPGIASGVNVVRTWALDAITDAYGNTVRFTYQQDTTNGDYWPVSINYTGHGSTAGTHTISFSYDNLASINAGLVWSRYEAGALISQTKRLHAITVATSGTTTFTYTLAYDTTLTDGKGRTGTERSRLDSVQECAGGVCYPKTTIGWQSGTSGWNAGQPVKSMGGDPIPVVSGQSYTSSILMVDVNGDGKADLVYPDGNYFMVMIANGNGFNAPISSGVPCGYDCAYYSQAIPMDIKGTSLQGLLVPLAPGAASLDWYALVPILDSNENFTGFQRVDTHQPYDSTGGNLMPSDWNGDGLTDVLFSDGTYLYLMKNNGDGSLAAKATIETGEFSDTSDNIVQRQTQFGGLIPSFDGSGNGGYMRLKVSTGPACTPDFCPPPTPPTSTWHIEQGKGDLTTPASFGSITSSPGNTMAPIFVDFNGDGLTDLLYADGSATDGSNWTWLTYTTDGAHISGLSTGIAWDSAVLQGSETVDYAGNGRQQVLMTYNGSSCSDWGIVGYAGGVFHGATDTGIATPLCAANYQMGSMRVADINGDGLDDLVWVEGGTVYYALHSGVAPDLVTSISNGFGQQYTVNYASLADSTVYTKGKLATYPTQAMQPALQVVDNYTANNGSAGTYTDTYQYSGAEADLHGRGFLGFADVTQTTNYGTDIEKTDTTYNQGFPETGYPASVTSSINNLTQRVTTYTYSDETTDGTAKYVYASNAAVDDYVVDSTTGANTVYRTTTNIAPSFRDPVTNTQDDVIHSSGITVSTSPASITSVTSTTYDVNKTSWCLSLPSLVTVTKTGTGVGAGIYGSELSRSVSYVNDTTNCHEKSNSVDISTTAGSQTLETGYGYDSIYGTLTSKTLTGTKVDGTTQEKRETDYKYDSTNTYVNTVTVDPITVDPGGFNLVTSSVWDPTLGVIDSQTAPDGATTQFSYDTFGVRTGEVLPDGTSISWDRTVCTGCDNVADSQYKVVTTHYSTNHVVGAMSTAYYDMNGRILMKVVPVLDGTTSDTTVSNIATQYDDMGRVTQVSSPYISAAQAWTYTKYDNFGRVSEIDTPAPSGTACSGGSQIGCPTKYAYSGLTTTVTDPNQNSTSKTLDAMGRVVQTTDGKGNTTTYKYDPFSDLREVDAPGGVTTTMTYDSAGRKKGMTDPDMGSWSYVDNPFGELVSQTNAKGQITTQTYDSVGRLDTRSDSVSGTSTWTYGTTGSNNGKLISEQGADGYLKTLQYDSIGRPSEVDVQLSGGTTYASNTTYDSFGHVQSVTYPETPTAVANVAPVAVTNGNQVVTVGQQVTLDASSSYDPDNGPQPITYSWSEISSPVSTGVDGSTSAQVSFTPSIAGTYEFLVTVKDGESIASASATITVKPVQVNGLTASAVNASTGAFTLSWSGAAGAKLYQLERAVGSGGYNLSGTTYSTTSAPLTETTDGTYHYGIQGCSDPDTNGDRVCADWSATLPVTITLAPAKPATPTTYPSGTTTGTYKVYWTAPTTTATGTKPVTISYYKLFRAVGNGAFDSVTNEGGALSSSTYNDNNGAYYYEVEACNSSCSAVSGVVRIIVNKPTPTVSLSPVGGTGSTLLSWHVTNGVSASSYTLQTASDSSFTSPTTVYTGSATSYTVNPGVATHYYRVRGYNGSSGWGVWSNTSTIDGTCKLCGSSTTTMQLNSTTLSPATTTNSNPAPADNSGSVPAATSVTAPAATTAAPPAAATPLAMQPVITHRSQSLTPMSPNVSAASTELASLRRHALQLLAGRSDPVRDRGDRIVGPNTDGVSAREQLAALHTSSGTAPHLVRVVATATSTSRYAVNYIYDAHEHLIEVVDAANSSLIYWQATSGNAFGEVNGELLGNTVINTRVYDQGTGQLLDAQSGVGGSTALVNNTYTWDGDGNLVSRTDNNANLTETFTYDSLNRLHIADTSGTQISSDTYNYDAIGNITSKTIADSTGSQTYTYQYDNSSSPLQLTGITPGSGSARSFSYDTNGNVLSDGVHSYTWNVQNKPTRITDGGVTTTFSYTPDGARYQEAMTDGEVFTEISPLFQIATDAGGTTTYKESILAGSGVVAIRAIRQDGLLTTRYLTHDDLGSVNTVTDEAGALKEQFSYDAFGQQRDPATWAILSTPSASLATDKGYTGQQQLNDQMAGLNLIHMNGRVYDPQIGRFISADPTVPNPMFSQAFNRYSYVYNNPLSMVDPSGFDPLSQVTCVGDLGSPTGCAPNKATTGNGGGGDSGSGTGGLGGAGHTPTSPGGNGGPGDGDSNGPGGGTGVPSGATGSGGSIPSPGLQSPSEPWSPGTNHEGNNGVGSAMNDTNGVTSGTSLLIMNNTGGIGNMTLHVPYNFTGAGPSTLHAWPTDHPGVITSPYGPRNLFGESFHYGVDLRARPGEHIYATENGTVFQINHTSRGGSQIFIKGTSGYVFGYAHIQPSSSLQVNDVVNAGEPIGSVYIGGVETAGHLHFSLISNADTGDIGSYVSGSRIDPSSYLDSILYMDTPISASGTTPYIVAGPGG